MMCETLTSSLIYVHLESRLGGGNAVVPEEVFDEIMTESFPDNDESYNPVDFMDLGSINRENHTEAHSNSVAKNQLQREILREARGKKDNIICTEGQR